MIELKYHPRPQQKEILDFFIRKIHEGKRIFLIEAPVGSGKSYLPSLLGDWYIKHINRHALIDVITLTKSLQRQYQDDFEHIFSLQGKNNYICHSYEESTCENGKVLNGDKFCDYCTYKQAQDAFFESTISLTNYHLFNSLRMYANEFFKNNRKSTILFVDEAHAFEENFCDFISSRLSHKVLNLIEIDSPNNIALLDEIQSPITAKNILMDRYLPEAFARLKYHKQIINTSDDFIQKSISAKKWKLIDNFICKFNRFIKDESVDNWVTTVSYTSHGERIIDIEPIWGHSYIQEYVWSHYEVIVLMSGTILDENIFTWLNGLNPNSTAILKLPHSFPVKHRPIFYLPQGKMSKLEIDKTWPKMVKMVEKILNRHKTHKGIIHVANYMLADKLIDSISDKRLITHTAENRDQILQEHIQSKQPSVLVSPSMTTGVDLKDDLSRFQIILKVPFPYLGSQKIKKRMQQNKRWYDWKTVNDLVQGYGRSIRSEKDWAYTYILDESFTYLYQKANTLIPEYFKEAIGQ